MKIAYLMPTYPMPSQTFIRREIAALEAQGLRIERFSVRRFKEELVDEADRLEQQKTCSILKVGAFGLLLALILELIVQPMRWFKAAGLAVTAGLRSERGLIRHVAYLAEACVLHQQLIRCSVQHLHVHFGTNAADVALLCRILGGPPYSITIHGPEEFDAPRPFGLERKIRHAAFVVAVSQFTRSQLYRWCPLADWRKIHVVHCGLDESVLSAPLAPSPNELRFVNVGRLSEQKGQLLLVEAAAKLKEEGYDFQLVIVGDGPLRDAIETRVNQLGLQGGVRVTGFLSNHEVRAEFLAARALVLPSFAEGLPVVIMEAFALGRPVISTFIAGIPELVEPGISGWLVPPGAVAPLARAMAEALTADPAELERMGRAGAQRVAQQHKISTEARKLSDLFRYAASNSHPHSLSTQVRTPDPTASREGVSVAGGSLTHERTSSERRSAVVGGLLKFLRRRERAPTRCGLG
jgi:glycosyltransferase involved in cell wall biosynthesis